MTGRYARLVVALSGPTAYPALAKSDADLLEEIFRLLTEHVKANAYGDDSAYADAISRLPKGLRAMAATHHLDISLTLDDIGWHFLNFGEPNFVRGTEAGLRELGLGDLAGWFADARDIVEPFLQRIRSGSVQPADEYYEWLDKSGNAARIDELTQLAQKKDIGIGREPSGSAIYSAWVAYARSKPENVFAG